MRTRGDLSQAQVDLLNMRMPGDQADRTVIDVWAELVGGGLSNEGAWSKIAGDIRQWGNMTRADRSAMIANGGEPVQRQLNKLRRLDNWISRYVIDMPRQIQMYNPVTGYKAGVQDMVGNTTHMLINGQFEAAAELYSQAGVERFWWMAKKPGQVQEIFTRDADPTLRAAGISLPSEVMHPHRQAKLDLEESELILHNALRNRGPVARWMGNRVVSQRVLDFRNGTDLLSRGTVMLAEYEKGHAAATSRFRTLLRRNGIDDNDFMMSVLQEAQTRTGDLHVTTFSVGDVQRVAGQSGLSADVKNQLSRAWREEQQGLIDAGRRAVRDAFFVGKRARGGGALSRVFYFHFWLTQSTMMHTRKMLESPMLMRSYVNLWDGAQEEAERRGYPPTMTGMIQFFRSESGMAGLWNPMLLVVPSFIFDSAVIGGDDSNGGFLDMISSMIPFTPLLSAALAVAGKADNVPDFLGTRGNWEKIFNTVQTFAASKGIDLTGGGSKPEAMILEEAYAKGLSALNRIAQVFGAEDYNPYLQSEGRSDNYTAILNTEAEKLWGPMDGWTAQQWDEYGQAYQSIKSGSRSTELSRTVQDIYANNQLGITALNLVTPGGVVMRYGPRDEVRLQDQAGVRSAGTKRNLQRATGQAGGLIIEQETARAGARTAIGDKDMKWVYAYQDIRDGFPDTTKWGPEKWVRIGGQAVTVAQLRAMPEAQRQVLADQYLAERQATGIYEDYESLRKTAESNVPGGQVKDFRAFQQLVYDYDGGPRGFRGAARSTSPNWARAESDYRKYLEGKGTKGAVLEEELDGWATGRASYQAFIGKPGSVYDADPLATGGTREFLTQARAGQGDPYTPTTAQVVEQQIMDARIQSSLNQLGIFAPLFGVQTSQTTMGPEAQMYFDWAASRPGRDNSPEAFTLWLVQNGGGTELDRLPSYFREYAGR
jgi:hypothetical protein